MGKHNPPPRQRVVINDGSKSTESDADRQRREAVLEQLSRQQEDARRR